MDIKEKEKHEDDLLHRKIRKLSMIYLGMYVSVIVMIGWYYLSLASLVQEEYEYSE